MRVIDISEIKIASINGKYDKGKNGRLYLSPKYRAFKDELVIRCKKTLIQPPYEVTIDIATACDIDNAMKAILDAVQTKGVITDDSQIFRLHIKKTAIKRGELGSVKVDVETYNWRAE